MMVPRAVADEWLARTGSLGPCADQGIPPDLVDEVIGATGTREVRPPAAAGASGRVLRLGIAAVPGRNSGYGQVMAELADGLYHRRRGADLLAGAGPGWLGGRGAGRRWRQPGASSLSRARDKLGADPLHMLFDHVAGPIAAGGAPGVSCCGLRVISMDDGRSTTDVPDSAENAAFFGRPSTAGREGAFPQVRWVTAAESGTGGADAGAGPAAVLRAGDAGAGRPELPVLVPGPRRAGHRRTSCGGPRRASRSGR